MRVHSEKHRYATILALAALVFVGLVRHAPIPQPPDYHAFADARTLFGIPRALDVLSNLPFVAVGLAGLCSMPRWSARLATRRERWAYALFFVGVHFYPSSTNVLSGLLLAYGVLGFCQLPLGSRLELLTEGLNHVLICSPDC